MDIERGIVLYTYLLSCLLPLTFRHDTKTSNDDLPVPRHRSHVNSEVQI